MTAIGSEAEMAWSCTSIDVKRVATIGVERIRIDMDLVLSEVIGQEILLVRGEVDGMEVWFLLTSRVRALPVVLDETWFLQRTIGIEIEYSEAASSVVGADKLLLVRR